MDTSQILFICGGAFAGLEKVIQARSSSAGIGFAAEVKGEKNQKDLGELLRDVEPEDLVKYGLIPEFVGRRPRSANHTGRRAAEQHVRTADA